MMMNVAFDRGEKMNLHNIILYTHYYIIIIARVENEHECIINYYYYSSPFTIP